MRRVVALPFPVLPCEPLQRTQQVAKLGGQLGRLLPELDSIYLFKFSQMYPMPPYTYVYAAQPMP